MWTIEEVRTKEPLLTIETKVGACQGTIRKHYPDCAIVTFLMGTTMIAAPYPWEMIVERLNTQAPLYYSGVIE